jgi:hypothetical protein
VTNLQSAYPEKVTRGYGSGHGTWIWNLDKEAGTEHTGG